MDRERVALDACRVGEEPHAPCVADCGTTTWGRGYDQRRGHFCATPAEAVAFEEADLHTKFERLAADYQALRERQAANEQVMTAAKEVMTAAKEKEQRLALEQDQLFATARWLIGDDGLARMRQN